MTFSGSVAEPSVEQAKNPNSVKEWRAGLKAHKKARDEFQSFIYEQYKKLRELDADNDPEC